MTGALQRDGLVREFQYTVRPSAGSNISMYEHPRGLVDLEGDGLTIDGQLGGHGGSGADRGRRDHPRPRADDSDRSGTRSRSR